MFDQSFTVLHSTTVALLDLPTLCVTSLEIKVLETDRWCWKVLEIQKFSLLILNRLKQKKELFIITFIFHSKKASKSKGSDLEFPYKILLNSCSPKRDGVKKRDISHKN